MPVAQYINIERVGSRQAPPAPLDPSSIEFGRRCTPNFFVSVFQGGEWREPRIEPLHEFSLHPASLVFHYAQSVFEGLKAYRWDDGSIALFRPEANAKRFEDSASRMDMPTVPQELFVQAVSNLADMERAFIPAEPGTLYIRPTMIASEPCIGVRGASEFIFFVIALPAGGYFKETRLGAGTVSVLVCESVARAARGGTGSVKTAANYAITLKTIDDAKHRGCDQVLFLDARGHRMIEEMGGMNIFFVSQGRLLTPPLEDTILPGITRDSILAMASDLELDAAERPLNIDSVIRDIEAGTITEALACGTAAAITGIRELRLENGRQIQVGNGEPGPVTAALYRRLTGIQFGREPDRFGWMQRVPNYGA